MAFSLNPNALFFVLILFTFAVFCCKSEDEEYDPAVIISRALVCFHDKYIYKSCEESCRLTQSGNINVSPEETDQFCEGPCFEESNHVLNCLNDVFSHFMFFNEATIKDVRATLSAGCSHTSERGNFNVAEHMESHAWKVIHSEHMYMLIMLGCYLLLWNHY